MNRCISCRKQPGCTWQAKIGANGCRAWEGLETMHTEKDLRWASKTAVENERERELAIWWEAYRAALSGYLANPIGYDHKDAGLCANHALSDYRAKREELGK